MGNMTRNVFKNLNLFLNGGTQAGNIIDFNPPKLALKAEEFRGGGMNAPVKLSMGMESMDTDFSLISYSPAVLALFNVREGADVAFTAREALEDFDGTITQRVIVMRGKVLEKDEGTHKAGEQASLKLSMNLSYYKDTVGGVVVQEIDIPNMIHNVNGIDALATVRNALGI